MLDRSTISENAALGLDIIRTFYDATPTPSIEDGLIRARAIFKALQSAGQPAGSQESSNGNR